MNKWVFFVVDSLRANMFQCHIPPFNWKLSTFWIMIRKDSIASCKEFLFGNIATGFLSEHPVPLPQQKVDVSGRSYFSSSLDAGLIFALQGWNIIKSTFNPHFPIQENSGKEQRHDRRGSSSLLSSSFQPSSIQVTLELLYFFIQSNF